MAGCVVLTGRAKDTIVLSNGCAAVVRLAAALGVRRAPAPRRAALRRAGAVPSCRLTACRWFHLPACSENVEPQPLEDLLCASPWIKFAGAALGGCWGALVDGLANGLAESCAAGWLQGSQAAWLRCSHTASRTVPSPLYAVLVGEDHRALGALIVPNAEALEELAAARGERQAGGCAPQGCLPKRQLCCGGGRFAQPLPACAA